MKQKNLFSGIFVFLMVFALMAVSVNAAQSAVNLGTAGNFVVLAKAGISTTGTTLIVGDIGVSPIDSTAITGFGLILDESTQFATSSIVTGKIYAADYSPPTPTKMTTAVSDMETAYTDAAGRTNPTATELGAGDISGMTIVPGLYKWGTGVMINTGVTLSGGANDVWIFQIAQDLTVGNGAIITLSGGAQAKNIFWQVAGQATLGTTSDFKGIILSQTAIAINTGAKLNGRALAQTAVTLDADTVTAPTGSATPTPTPTPTPATTPSPTPATNTGNTGGSGTSVVINAKTDSTQSNSGSAGKTTVIAPKTVTVPKTASVSTSDSASASASGNANIQARLDSNRSGNGESKEAIIARINLRTGLNISLVENASLGSVLRVYLSNGRYAYIKVLPAEASAKAQAELKAKCEERNCTVELKEAKVKGTARAVYEVKTEKKAKLIGFISVKKKVGADIDAETGAVVAVKRPLWSFLAKEENA